MPVADTTRGSAGKSTKAARRAARRAASPTFYRARRRKTPYTPSGPGSDAAQRPGAQTQRKEEARNRGRSDAAAPAGAGGYRLTPAERRYRDRVIRDTAGRVKARRRSRAVRDAISEAADDVLSVATQTTPTPKRSGRRLPGATASPAAAAADRAGGLGYIPTRAIRAAGTALVEDPVGTSKQTAKGFKDALVGAPGALLSTAVETVEGTAEGDPLRGVKKSGKSYIDDVVRRYAPLLKEGDAGVREFKERVKREGLSAEAMDAAILAGGVGGQVSRGVSAAAQRRPESRAGRIVTEPRRRERTSGGEAREQETAPGFFKAARQKRRDEAAFRGQQRTVARADRTRERDDGTIDRGAVDAVVREATERGEVVPSRLAGVEVGRRGVRARRAPSGRKIAKRERVEVAQRQGRELQSLRRVQREEGVAGAAKGAGRAYAGLNRREKVAYKAAIQGARTPAAGRRWAQARIRRIEAAVARGDTDVAAARELPALRRLAAEPERYFTRRLAEVAEGEVARAKRAAAIDPRLGATVAERERVAELRRNQPAFTVLGVQRKGRTVAQAERAARERRDRGRRDAVRAERRLLEAERQVGAAEETGRRVVARGRARDEGRVERARRSAEIHRRAAANHRRRAEKARSPKMREGHLRKAEAAEERAGAAAARVQRAAPADDVRLRRRVVAARGRREEVRAEIRRARQEVRAGAAEGREARALRRELGRGALDPRTAEPIPQFLERGRQARAEAGFSEPGYFQSAPREQRRFGVFTVGGVRAVPRDKRYRGVLFEQGREDGSFTTYAQGLARNFKAAHNYRLIEDVIREHAFPWSRNRSVEELRKELDRRGIDPASVGFWNPGVFREAGQSADVGRAMGRIEDNDAILDTPEEVGEAFDEGQAQLSKAVELATDTGRWAESRDWVIVPKGVMDELSTMTRPSHWFWRGLDVVKGKQARILLGTSPAWLQFQVASNLLLTSLAGVGPLEIARAQRWWRRLSDEEKAAIEPYVGVGHFQDSRDQVKIGAAANGRVLNAWRAMKEHPFWHKPRRPLRGGAVSQLNPLDALFRVDNAQNNAFRKAVLYNRLKRDAYQRMGANLALQQRLLDRAVGHFRYTRPEQTMSALARDQRVLERHAQSVSDFLGDYQTYTARERRILQRNVMFYGFLRFSLRFAFYTMPVKHPVMTSIIGQLGQLQTEEVRRLLGGDELPWAMGRFYFEKNGQLRSVNVARANPFLNTVTEADPSLGVIAQTRNVMRLMPPVYVSLFNQAFSKSSFRDRPFRVEGENQGRPPAEYGDANRARIMLNEMARLNAIYRTFDKATQGGVPHGDDSLLGDRPTGYKRSDIVAGLAEDKQKFRDRGGFWGAVGREFVPLVPQPDDSVETARQVRAAKGEAAAPAPVSPEQARELELLRREAQQAGEAAAPDAAELEKLRREAALAGG
jgi:hypothetical protein